MEDLAGGVGVPGGACARGEGDAYALEVDQAGCDEGFDPDLA